MTFTDDRISGMDSMSKSMNAASLAVATATANANNVSGNSASHYQSHSRSSSHDTSLILLGDQVKRSQSNSSLSDQSSPPQGSPKLPMRRRHNKPTAPTPPDMRGESLIKYIYSYLFSQDRVN